MADWTKVGTDLVTGGAVGAVDQVLQNQDEKRRREDEAAGKTFSMWKAFGTYYNYGLPLLALVGVGMGWLSGDWATRAVVAGGQLAGRKGTYQATKAVQSAPWRPVGSPPARQTTQPEFSGPEDRIH